MTNKTSPIGIIDSGIGGFSVVRKVQEYLPNEHLLYFGDSANVPYGNHTGDEILTLTRYMLQFMEEKQVKILLVACNTISCLIDRCRSDMSCPVVSVVQAGVDAVKSLELDRVGVISTCFTADSRCYPNLIGEVSPKTQVFSHGCPDMARVVEHYFGRPDGQKLIDSTIQKDIGALFAMGKIDCCVLGCTHFPLVEASIKRLFPGLKLIDPAEQMAKTVQAYLEQNDLANEPDAPGTLDIFTTGDVEEYSTRAEKTGLTQVSSIQFYPPIGL